MAEAPLTPLPGPAKRRPAAVEEDDVFNEPKRRRLPQDETDPIDVFCEVQNVFPNADEEFLRSEIEKVSQLHPKLKVQVVVHAILGMKSFPTINKVVGFSMNQNPDPNQTSELDFTISEATISVLPPLTNKMTSYLAPEYKPNYSNEGNARSKAIEVIFDRFFPFQKNGLRRVWTLCEFRVARTTLVILRSIESPKLLKAIIAREKKRIPRLVDSIMVKIEDSPKQPVQRLLFLQQWRAPNSAYVPAGIKEYRSIIEENDAVTAWLENNCASRKSVSDDDGFECGCCFTDASFSKLIQCCEGHLFCYECISSYADSVVSGVGKAVFTCLMDDCDEAFPKDQLRRCINAKQLHQIEEREQQECVNRAVSKDGQNLLHQCPFCQFRGLVPKEEKVFQCLRQECMKESCRFCQEEWAEHFGIPCEELEKKDEASLRTRTEEQMTQARIRLCPECKTPLLKEEGCNKMTCRCHATLCYACRIPNIAYDHFCQHVRDPGLDCKSCKKCFLWSNVQEDDLKVMEEIRLKAEVEHQEKGFKEGTHFGTELSPANRPRPKPAPAPLLVIPDVILPLVAPAPLNPRPLPALPVPVPLIVNPAPVVHRPLVPNINRPLVAHAPLNPQPNFEAQGARPRR